MRGSSAGVAIVIDDEPAIRGLLATILSDYGCAVATGAGAADLDRVVGDFDPDILFLDLGLRDTDGIALLGALAERGFRGAVQIVSGRSQQALDEGFRAGVALGLRMRSPLSKPFRAAAIGDALAEEGLLRPSDGAADADIRLVSRPWACASAAVGLIDLAIAWPDATAEGRPSPADQLLWWTAVGDRFREPLLDLPAPAAICIDARVSDIAEMMPGLRRIDHSASRPAATIVLGEDDVFADLAATRDLLCVLRLCGATIRLTGCGTRFFAVAGHDPLPVDQAVLGNPLASADRVMHRLSDLAHRAGTLLLADDLASAPAADTCAPGEVDLWRDASQSWQPFATRAGASSNAAEPRRPTDVWRPVALTDALSVRRMR